MKSLKPLILSFSLLAFTGAYAADEAKKQSSDTQAKPAMSQTDNKAGASAGASTPAPTSAETKDEKTTGASAGASASGAMAGGMSAKKLVGTDVVDAQGKKLGEIDEVVLDMGSGRVHAAVLGFGGFLGMGEKHYAFPVSELQPAKDKGKLQLNVDKEKLKDAEGFAKGKYPAMNDEYWARIGKQDQASAGGGQKPNLVRASEVIGQDVQDKSGKQVGEVKDVMLSADNSRIQNIVIDVEDAGEATVEAKSLSMGTGDKLVIDMSGEQLKSQAKPAEKRAQSRTDRSRPVTSGAAGAGTSAGMKQDDKQAQSGSKAAGSASAGASAGKKSFSELDKDSDGSLSQMEAAADANAKSSFAKLDKDNDKKLSRSEYEAAQDAAAGGTAKKPGEQKEQSK